jgi:hypothetical protein
VGSDVIFLWEFALEAAELPSTVVKALAAKASLLRQDGPKPGRPHADTLTGSQFANMKELACRIRLRPCRQALIFVAADKAGASQRRFYETLIAKADHRFAEHLENLKGQ